MTNPVAINMAKNSGFGFEIPFPIKGNQDFWRND